MPNCSRWKKQPNAIVVLGLLFTLFSTNVTANSCGRFFADPLHDRSDAAFYAKFLTLNERKTPQSTIDKLDPLIFNNEQNGFYLLKHLPPGKMAHLGLSGDFNYTIMAKANSNFGVIYDSNPNVILFHLVFREAVLQNPGASEFLSYLKEVTTKGADSTLFKTLHGQMRKAFPNLDIRTFETFLKSADLHQYFSAVRSLRDDSGTPYSYLASKSSYDQLRSLFLENRIQYLLASHLEPDFTRKIGRHFENVRFGTVYVSNSLEFNWLGTPSGLAKTMEEIKKKLGVTMSGFHSLSGIRPENLLGDLNRLADQLDAAGSEKDAKTVLERNFELINQIGLTLQLSDDAFRKIRFSREPWKRYWNSTLKLNLSEDAVFLSTNRNIVLFGRALNPSQTYPIDESSINGLNAYHWTYATIPVERIKESGIDQMPQAYYETVKKVRDKLSAFKTRSEIKFICSEILKSCF